MWRTCACTPVQDSPASLTKALRWTYMTGGALTVILIIRWPLLALPAGVFSKGYFTMWIIIALVWGVAATATTLLLPLWESREHIMKVLRGGRDAKMQVMPGQAAPWVGGAAGSKDVAAV